MPDTYTLLEKVVVGAANATTVTFTSIPQTYTDLVLMCTIRTTGGIQAIDFRFNNDTGSNYSWRYAQGTGTGIDPGTGSGQTVFSEAMVANGSASTANNFSNSTLYIPNYTSSSNKSFSLDTVEEENASNAYCRLESGAWNNTAAITSINLSASGDFVQYSTFYLYGVAALGVTPTSAPKATGGDSIVTDGTYWYHAFTSSSTFTPKQSLSCDVLVVAGGGGSSASGGGAGGLLGFSAQALTTTNYTVTIGGGGAGGVHQTSDANDGSNSQFGSLTACVGGGGGRAGTGTTTTGKTGGSGGGGTALNTASTGAGGSATSGQGYAGGSGTASAGAGNAGGAGGGAGAVGGNSVYNSSGGNGGAGLNTYSSWANATSTGVSGFYAGGGGGQGGNSGSYLGTGGAGGGGAAALAGSAGTANTGGGAGAVYNPGNTGKSGGSGIVIVRYAV